MGVIGLGLAITILGYRLGLHLYWNLDWSLNRDLDWYLDWSRLRGLVVIYRKGISSPVRNFLPFPDLLLSGYGLLRIVLKSPFHAAAREMEAYLDQLGENQEELNNDRKHLLGIIMPDSFNLNECVGVV